MRYKRNAEREFLTLLEPLGGEREKLANGAVRIVLRSGAIINYWPTTGTFNVQGSGPTAETLLEVCRLIDAETPLPDTP
jgi:hypothetical protein